MAVRLATSDDLDAMVARSNTVRRRQAELEPVFWRPAGEADSSQRAWFALLLDDPSHRVLVSTGGGPDLAGFVIARAMEAPPVYDPGGRTCLVDDLAWMEPEVADGLLAAVRSWAAEMGCVQLVVVTPAGDPERRALLERTGLHPTSEWWTGPV